MSTHWEQTNLKVANYERTEYYVCPLGTNESESGNAGQQGVQAHISVHGNIKKITPNFAPQI